MKKILLKLSLTALTVMCFSTGINAKSNNSETASNHTTYQLTEQEKNQAVLEVAQNELARQKANKPVTRGYDDEMMLLKEVGHKDVWTGYRQVPGQSLKGTIFRTKGSGFYWSDARKTNGTVSLSASIGGKVFSISVGFQPGTVVQASGKIAKIRDNQVNKRVKLYVRREYRVTRYAVYTYKKYQGPSKAKFYKYQNAAAVVGEDLDVKNV